ncbi:hypothetical protein T492DRAFT_1072663 [Pavlovales sp. CCMP2436]|nr:hypothetical protein T492DRAFT_1072663 [Pavlovales sp. CCMP2436]
MALLGPAVRRCCTQLARAPTRLRASGARPRLLHSKSGRQPWDYMLPVQALVRLLPELVPPAEFADRTAWIDESLTSIDNHLYSDDEFSAGWHNSDNDQLASLQLLNPARVPFFHEVMPLDGRLGVLAQELLKVVPPHTHDWRLYVRPEELSMLLQKLGFEVDTAHFVGMKPSFDLSLLPLGKVPLGNFYQAPDALRVNYLGWARRRDRP